MIKGWRNNPAWVAHFEKKKVDRIQRQIDRARANAAINQALRQAEASARNFRVHPIQLGTAGY